MENEYGTCNFCGEEGLVDRTYYHYDVDCDCCSGDKHFEIVWHCYKCAPHDLGITSIQYTKELKHKI